MDFLKDCIPSRWILVLMVLLVAILAPRKGWAQAIVLAFLIPMLVLHARSWLSRL